MSYRELVEEALTHDWQSTAEIASAIPYRFIARTSHLGQVYQNLCKFELWGIAEKQICHDSGTNAYWRLVQ